MNKPTLSLLLLMLLCGISFAQADALPDQLQQIEALQRRADKLAFGALGADNYYLAKARTWVDLALGEYHENEGTELVAAAIGQAEVLLDALEKKQPDISMDTPMQAEGSEAVRPDLWKKISALKTSEKFSCGQRSLAEAEVYLVWAGHEKLESGWAHAQSYAHSAEDLIKEAQGEINKCATPAAPMVAQIAPPPVVEKITLSSDALFVFGEAALDPSAQWRLNRLADTIKMTNALEEVVLVGHSDRLRRDGHPERNQLLSEQRAESIKKYLVGKGIAADKIHASGAGATQPLVQCPTSQSREKQVICLQPNRRVEIILHGAK